MSIINKSTQDGGEFQIRRLRNWRGKTLALGGNAVASYAVGILKNLKGDVDWKRIVKDEQVPRDVAVSKVGMAMFQSDEPFEVDLKELINDPKNKVGGK